MAFGQKVTQIRARRAQLQAQAVHASDPQAQPLDVALLDVERVAVLLGVPVKQVYALIYEHGLPVRHLGRAVRVHPGELDAWTRRKRDLHSPQSAGSEARAEAVEREPQPCS